MNIFPVKNDSSRVERNVKNFEFSVRNYSKIISIIMCQQLGAEKMFEASKRARCSSTCL